METSITQSPPFILPNQTADDAREPDTLSLRDLPTTVDQNQTNRSRRSASSSSSTEDPTSDFFFEFLINNDDDLITSAADDVIFHGRLLPYAPPHRPRRSLSLSSRKITDSNFDSVPTSIRPSKSLNYRKLHRNKSNNHHHRNNSKPNSEFLLRNYNSEKLIPAKSPWYWLTFGLPKIPAEMELKDIKNRQIRRNIASSKSLSGEKSCRPSCSSASWRILSVLSCKSHVTVDVNNTPPFRINNALM